MLSIKKENGIIKTEMSEDFFKKVESSNKRDKLIDLINFVVTIGSDSKVDNNVDIFEPKVKIKIKMIKTGEKIRRGKSIEYGESSVSINGNGRMNVLKRFFPEIAEYKGVKIEEDGLVLKFYMLKGYNSVMGFSDSDLVNRTINRTPAGDYYIQSVMLRRFSLNNKFTRYEAVFDVRENCLMVFLNMKLETKDMKKRIKK